MLMAKCRTLQENEEIGREASEGKVRQDISVFFMCVHGIILLEACLESISEPVTVSCEGLMSACKFEFLDK